MRTRIQRWGNSLGLRIPRAFAREVRVEPGAEVDLRVRRGSLVVAPVRRRGLRLRDLLARVTPGNLHGEIDTGSPVGRELL